jgi:hypothetical protein
VDNGTLNVAPVVFQRCIAGSVQRNQPTATWHLLRNRLSLHSLMMIPLRVTCLRKGQGFLILRAPMFSNDEECSSSSSASATPGESMPWAYRAVCFYDTDLCLYRRGTLELGLPQIVAVGSQSVGKSSLIENISGVREMSGPKLVSPFRVDYPPSRQWHMHQVSGHYMRAKTILMHLIDVRSNVICLLPRPPGGQLSASAALSIAMAGLLIGQP